MTKPYQALRAYELAVARERAEAMLRLKKKGHTLQQIGDLFELSRERVRQLLAAHFGDFPKMPAGRKPAPKLPKAG